MAGLKLIAAPVFDATVNIPVHGGDPAPVVFSFKHRTQDELKEWRESLEGKPDSGVILEMIEGWEFDDELTVENAETLVQNYSGAAIAILTAYLTEIAQAKAKN